MAVPRYSELLARKGVESPEMEQTIQKSQLMELSVSNSSSLRTSPKYLSITDKVKLFYWAPSKLLHPNS